MMDVKSLTDAELGAALREHGLSVPINSTSRPTCERKLLNLLGGGDMSQTIVVDPTESSMDAPFQDAEAEIVESVPTPRSAVKTAQSTTNGSQSTVEYNPRRRNAPAADFDASRASDSDSGETSFRLLNADERARYSPPSGVQPVSVWKYVAYGVLAIVLISFLTFLNRNAQATDEEL